MRASLRVDLTNTAKELSAHSGISPASIVVIPFRDVSPGQDNEYFSDGLTEEIITDLSQIQDLRVISVTSAMKLKDSSRDLKAIGREHGVQYALEGTVRKSGKNVRITVHLVNVLEDAQLWAEKYSGDLEDVFEIQENVSRSVLEAMKLKLSPTESERLTRTPLGDLDTEGGQDARPPGDELLKVLRSVRLFEDRSDDDLLKMGSCMKTVHFSASETIMEEGDPGVAMYSIKSGRVEVLKKRENGSAFRVADLGAGTTVGEMSVFGNSPRRATVKTLEPTVCLTMNRVDLEVILGKYPEISLGLARDLAKRLEEANRMDNRRFISLTSNANFDPDVVRMLPESLVWRYKMVPIGFKENTVFLAMVDFNNLDALDAARRHLKGMLIETVFCPEEDFKTFIEEKGPNLSGPSAGSTGVAGRR